jgi:hypothetical protein
MLKFSPFPSLFHETNTKTTVTPPKRFMETFRRIASFLFSNKKCLTNGTTKIPLEFSHQTQCVLPSNIKKKFRLRHGNKFSLPPYMAHDGYLIISYFPISLAANFPLNAEHKKRGRKILHVTLAQKVVSFYFPNILQSSREGSGRKKAA